MIRSLLVACCLLTTGLFGTLTASAQDWAQKLFQVTSHDFGTVARGSQPEFAFEITNIYEEPVEIAEVRTSCGCTTPQITKRHLKTWEKGAVVATLNTRSFTGSKQATLTVVISKPFPAEVQLSIQGNIRSDVVFEPWQVDFREVPQGRAAEQRVIVTHAGKADWQIVDVRSANPHFEVELLSENRAAGRVRYELLVRLLASAPAGHFQDELTFVTNDPKSGAITLPIQGQVLTPLTVNPASLFLGVLHPGQAVTKRLVVRGTQPFRVLQVDCGNEAFQFEVSDEAKTLHFIPVTFQADQQTGELNETIQIATDLGGGTTVTCTATATIQPRP